MGGEGNKGTGSRRYDTQGSASEASHAAMMRRGILGGPCLLVSKSAAGA